MKLKKYIKTLKRFIKEHPEAKNYRVIASKDDEGNGYTYVHYDPSVGYFDREAQEFETKHHKHDCVCIN